MARVLKPNRYLAEKFREESPDETAEEVKKEHFLWIKHKSFGLCNAISLNTLMLLAVQRLVRMTITHDEYPLEYLFPSDAEVCVFHPIDPFLWGVKTLIIEVKLLICKNRTGS